MIGWDDLANLADGTIVQVLGNICGGMGKKSKKKKEKNPWESDVSGVPLAQEVPWSVGSSAEEQFEAVKKDELMGQFEKDLGSGALDTLSRMETKQAQDMLTKLEENMAGISEEKKENGGMEFDVDGRKEKGGTAGERRKRESGRKKKLEEESERRESQSKNSETASENLMDDRSRKWEDRRRLEREGDEIIKLLVKT